MRLLRVLFFWYKLVALMKVLRVTAFVQQQTDYPYKLQSNKDSHDKKTIVQDTSFTQNPQLELLILNEDVSCYKYLVNNWYQRGYIPVR